MATSIDVIFSYRFLVVFVAVLFLAAGYFDVANIHSAVHQHMALVQDKVSYFATGSQHNYHRQESAFDEVCRVQFVFAGAKYNYNQFPTLQSWIRFADPTCPIEFLRTNHPFLGLLNIAEARMFHELAFLPILQADMLKLLAVYYLGGVVVDLDVEARKRFPQDWTGVDTPLASCDVVLGMEASCDTDECLKMFVRKGQIQNWAMYSRRPQSQFFGEMFDFIVAKYESMAPLNKGVSVQEVAGSGPITDFVQQYGNFSRPHYLVEISRNGGSLQSDTTNIMRIRKQHEEICIVGRSYTGGGCAKQPQCLLFHHFEGSWRRPA
ncbi:unnamed protein product [Aphanomyces euteiches]|uniref:Alpha 1,4-glycosyltransferase domain-containing protein n=1 Tax=Aphanomyces euteiches TaxID=100861 RepID=A0A6G0XM66_9STRA|nr:hypothetical protein Ae201684_003169 [Aphanomyces euteiches]KAH9098239.1 hypothetical protein Ae201684P_017456 [Aphanomyces euteiches]KAH9142391.1 hypothetical protein AeRB84_013531 [Aphanomyces euteiches]